MRETRLINSASEVPDCVEDLVRVGRLDGSRSTRCFPRHSRSHLGVRYQPLIDGARGSEYN